MTEKNTDIILFDGVCNFCNASINFVIRHDKKNIFKFASLQSEIAKTLIPSSALEGEDAHLNSIVYLENGRLYTKSTAVLRILKKLGGFYSLAYAFIVVPPFIRNFVYDSIARNRYKWFGKRENCMVPTAEVRAKFLD
jgi:predicted DCC family thiol-disulfide oxidoreductase YuxK